MKFSSSETGNPIVVSEFGELEYSANDDESLMAVTLKSCPTGINRNQSSISKEVMKKALPSFSNKPILCEIVDEVDEHGNEYKDFGSHAMSIYEDAETGEIKTHYIEKCVGIIPESCNPRMIYDKKMDRTYTVVDGYIFNLYGNETSDIIKKNNGTKVSVEIAIDDMEWDEKNDCLDIKAFKFLGVTLLG